MMTPARTGKGKGNLEFDRVFPGVGRIRRSSGTRVLREFHRRDAILTKLYETSQLAILIAFKEGRLAIEQLVEQDRVGRGGETLEILETRKPLWATVDATLPLMGGTASSRARYALSFRQLRARSGLPNHAPIAVLKTIPWQTLAAAWPGSEADWNRMRAAVSRFCTVAMGDKWSPFRRAVMAAIPRAVESDGRTPDLTLPQFVRVLEQVPDDAARAAFMLLVLTGMRVGEYLSLDRSMLHPGTHRVKIPRVVGNKTGAHTVGVDASDWGWVLAAVPFAGRVPPQRYATVADDPRYYRLRTAWAKACAALEITDVRLHDLRHCAGQWASNEGVSSAAIQDMLGHKDPRMTARYTRMAAAAKASGSIGAALRRAGGAR